MKAKAEKGVVRAYIDEAIELQVKARKAREAFENHVRIACDDLEVKPQAFKKVVTYFFDGTPRGTRIVTDSIEANAIIDFLD